MKYIFCYEEQVLVIEGSKEKRYESCCVKSINSRYYFGEEAKQLQLVWPNLPRTYLNQAIREVAILKDRKQLVETFLNLMINGSDHHVFIMPRDIIEILVSEEKEFLNQYSIQVSLIGFGLFYSKMIETANKGKLQKNSNTIHIYQGNEGIEGVLSEVISEGKLQTISEIYMKPSNQILILNKVIEHLEKQARNNNNLKLYIKKESELVENFPYQHILEQVDKNKTFAFNSIDHIDVIGSYRISKLQYDIKGLAMHLIERVPDEKYKTLFTNIVSSFHMLTLKQQDFILNQLKKLILQAQPISKRNLEKLRDIFLNRPSTTYKVGFFSPFSYGKSSLINGLIGWPLLKADIRAETAVVTHITYADKYSLFWVNDEEIICSRFDTIEQFKREVERITSVHTAEKSLQHLYLTLPYETRYPLIEWVDTPGLFAKYEYHHQIAENTIEDLNLVVYVFDPTKIGEKPFLNKIKEYTETVGEEKTLFAIGKRDSVIDSLDLIENDLRQHIPKNLQGQDIVSVSGYFALKARQYETGQHELVELQKDYLIYALYPEDSYSGKRLELHHIDRVLEMSNIGALERVIYKKARQWYRGWELNESSTIL